MKRPPASLPPLLLAGIAAFALSTAPTAADVVHLKNGQKLEGEAVEANGEVAIRSAMGELRLPADLVVRIERGMSPGQAATRRLEALRPNDTEGRLELAMDLQSKGETTLARRIYAEVLELDPDHPIARRSLGYVRCDGDWTSEQECHRRGGEVLYQGQWISADQRTMLETLELQRRQAELERLRARVQLEAARLDADRLASAATAYQDPRADAFGYPFDPFYGAVGTPFWPTFPFSGLAPFDPLGHRGRFLGHGKLDGRGAGFGGHRLDHGKRSFDRPLHHRGGQPPRPLVPQQHRGTIAPPNRGASPAAPPSGIVPSPQSAAPSRGR
ncbi:MAG TPA: hypothetical protein VMS86_07420 [Thermoanaerobaculia bacterium]|nr:hypothetical protein [Thermoanaerobaculia bacterium]